MPLFAATVLVLLSGLAAAAARAEPAEISALGMGDRNYLRVQRERVNDLAARYLGRSLSGVKSRDLDTLQELLDRDIVTAGQTLELQAMGVVMGNLMADEHRLRWVVYQDDRGRSRALQLDERPVFVFPITIISRRVDVGLEVDVAALYAKAIAEIQDDLDNRYRRDGPIPGAR